MPTDTSKAFYNFQQLSWLYRLQSNLHHRFSTRIGEFVCGIKWTASVLPTIVAVLTMVASTPDSYTQFPAVAMSLEFYSVPVASPQFQWSPQPCPRRLHRERNPPQGRALVVQIDAYHCICGQRHQRSYHHGSCTIWSQTITSLGLCAFNHVLDKRPIRWSRKTSRNFPLGSNGRSWSVILQ
jgi:hypothetical protein